MTGQRFHRTTEAIPRHSWKSKSIFVSRPIKVSTDKGGAKGAPRFDAVLPPFISIVRSPVCPAIFAKSSRSPVKSVRPKMRPTPFGEHRESAKSASNDGWVEVLPQNTPSGGQRAEGEGRLQTSRRDPSPKEKKLRKPPHMGGFCSPPFLRPFLFLIPLEIPKVSPLRKSFSVWVSKTVSKGPCSSS